MTEYKSILGDNEFLIMSEIAENATINQRALSKKIGLSLGSINALINKMVKEGMIKMEQASGKQVAYILTPAGMIEKAQKTVRYLKIHYKTIYETKEKIKDVLNMLAQEYHTVYVFKSEDEMGDILEVAVNELHADKKHASIKIIYKKHMIRDEDAEPAALLYALEDPSAIKDICNDKVTAINLADML